MSDDAKDARRARDEQLTKLEHQVYAGAEVSRVATTVRRLRDENHWGELLTAAMEANR